MADRGQVVMNRLQEAGALSGVRAWDELGSWDEADIERFLARYGSLYEGVQRQAVIAGDAVVAIDVTRQTGIPTRPVGVDSATIIRPAENLVIPFRTTWKRLEDGYQWRDAVRSGRSALMAQVRGDVQRGYIDGGRAAMAAQPAVTWYQRVISTTACMFCASASTRTYYAREPQPLHPHCGCSVSARTTERPGEIADPELFEKLKGYSLTREDGTNVPYWERSDLHLVNGEVVPRP